MISVQHGTKVEQGEADRITNKFIPKKKNRINVFAFLRKA